MEKCIIFGYRDREKVDFLITYNPEEFKEMQKNIKTDDDSEYLGEIELPDELNEKIAIEEVIYKCINCRLKKINAF